jgi:AcrR family transcriptional regulator
MTDQPTDSDASPRRERRDAAANRQHILAAARTLFAAHGVDQTSMSEIARVAGVGPGTLYRRYAHKGQLCEALLLDDIQAFCARVERTQVEAGSDSSALDLVAWLIDELLVMTEGHLPLLAAMQEAAVGPRRGEHFTFPFHRWLNAQLVGLLSRAVTDGEVAPLHIEITADAIQAAAAPPLVAFQLEQRGLSRQHISAALRHLFVDGLRATSGQASGARRSAS